MNEIKVVGFDPSLRNTGIALARIDIVTLAITVDDLYLADTDKQSGKQVRVNSDDLRRASVIVAAMHAKAKSYGARFAIAEIPSGSQSARANLGFGVCIGALASLQLAGIPIIQVQPVDTKLASTGKKTASKDDIIAWAMAKYPDLPWLTRKLKGAVVPIKDNEHLADATAVIHAGVLTAEFAQAVALMRGMMCAAA